jgi:hypothetical protein
MTKRMLLATTAILCLGGATARAQTFAALANYAPAVDGAPSSALSPDGSGGFLSTVAIGPDHEKNGAVVHFTQSNGVWTTTAVYAFRGGNDGGYPQGSLVPDGNGGYYGVTFRGGINGVGTFYDLTPSATPGQPWTHTILYNFVGGDSDSAGPHGDLQLASDGSYVGSSGGKGASGAAKNGTIYKLFPPATSGGAWTEAPLALFAGPPTDGASPLSPVLDASGVIYDPVISGGAQNKGEIVELSPPPDGSGLWTKTVLHVFTRNPVDGAHPEFLTEGVDGSLYGLCGHGGAYGGGRFFHLTQSGGVWTETALYDFGATAGDSMGAHSVYLQGDGSWIGTSGLGGTAGEGTIFQLEPSGGVFTNTVLFNMTGGEAGENPRGTLFADGNGGFYGSTNHGGKNNRGLLFDFTP